MSDHDTKSNALARMVGGGERGQRLQSFRNALELYEDELSGALMGSIDPKHFIEIATTALIDPDSKLLECHPPTVFTALRKAAQLRLRPDGEEGALIPFYSGKRKQLEAVFQPMYKGLVRTVLRTGMYTKVEARVARTGDHFHYQLGLDPTIEHRPAPPSEQGDIEYAYAIAWLRSGGTQFEVMHREEMDEIRSATKKRNNGREGPAWSTSYGAEQMYRKMPVKRLAKFLELDHDQAAVFWYDDQIERGRHGAEPADRIPEAEWRTVDERMTQRGAEQVESIMDRVKQASEPVAESLDELKAEADEIAAALVKLERISFDESEELDLLYTDGSVDGVRDWIEQMKARLDDGPDGGLWPEGES